MPMRSRRVATAQAAMAGQTPRVKGFSANQSVDRPARSAATACSTQADGGMPPWARSARLGSRVTLDVPRARRVASLGEVDVHRLPVADRKSTRLNSSHLVISYAVFCLKKKKNNE